MIRDIQILRQERLVIIHSALTDGIRVAILGKNPNGNDVVAIYPMLEGNLHAATAFGKTVVCCNLIAKRKVNTLILVDRAILMNQWIKQLDTFLSIDEELPEYTTKTGRIKKRKHLSAIFKEHMIH
ncbi:MAG: DEAD/DEAH box helicase family protein [Eubacterium sp.]|nr:DEAD/DEAH box helicase family protein [Eubacterium sp.]